MKRRNFIKTTAATALTATTVGTAAANTGTSNTVDQQIYELRVYDLIWNRGTAAITEYLSEALIPALNRYGCSNVGVFKEMNDPTPPKIYVLIPYNSMDHYAGVADFLIGDDTYQVAQKAYRDIPVERKIYDRFHTYLMRAFAAMPEMKVPEQKERIFELRTYEGYSEDAVSRKVKMFNSGEIPIFLKTGLHPVFFGHIISGPSMPALTYMLHFEDMEERDANWKAFIDHPDWKKMSGMEEYANTVSNIIREFLVPMDISQV